ncbi:MAG TPA: hypothetical protein VKA68_05155 [bacterium]|nr:hypothetical protein [bacterium]
MNASTFEKALWNSLIASGEFSLGQFVVSVHEQTVRVFHSRSRTITHLNKDSSFTEMSELCRRYGYTLTYLLRSTQPKTYHILQESEARFRRGRPPRRK